MSDDAITTLLKENRRFQPPAEFAKHARIGSRAEYDRLYRESLENPDAFWRREAEGLVFRTPWTQAVEWKLPHAKWFVGATLNVTESCLDQHLTTWRRNKAAIVWEGEFGNTRTLTYRELARETNIFANALAKLGVEKGDRVLIYMGMVPEVVVAMLACARLGAVHTVVFGGFAADAIKDRIADSQAKVVVTQDGGHRRGNVLALKATVDKALENPATSCVKAVVVYRHLGDQMGSVAMKDGRDHWWHDVYDKAHPKRAATIVDAEHPLFILYTSGSTGKPKGVLHTTAGYLVGTHVTTKYCFDLRDEDVYWCTADVGWVTGHSYIVYGP
ncbi:MAG TPA: AMP-binding protein, partial [Minicystis sp.]|nr:AMP-binding protein [Minicystis sp.]